MDLRSQGPETPVRTWAGPSQSTDRCRQIPQRSGQVAGGTLSKIHRTPNVLNLADSSPKGVSTDAAGI